MRDNDYKIVEAMETYGGSFVQALAVCIRRADPDNFAKIKATWPEYWKQYKEMAGVKSNEEAIVMDHLDDSVGKDSNG